MAYVVAYCQNCKALYFEPERIDEERLKEMGAKELSNRWEFWGYCNGPRCGPQIFSTVQDLSDL
jgi:hypothetical protein